MISSKEAYEIHLKTVTAIPLEDIEKPKMARDDTIGEAEELCVTAKQDKERLVGKGLDPGIIEQLDERIGVYAHASSLFENALFEKSAAKQQWTAMEKDAYAFKWEMIHNFKFALRKEPDQLKLVGQISKGRGRRDLVLDFKDLEVLGQKNRPALEKINFDFSALAKSAKLHDELSNLLAESNTSEAVVDKNKLIAHQAYTWLKQAVDEIREYGQFCFWKDPLKLSQYQSGHYQSVGKTKATPPQETTVETPQGEVDTTNEVTF